MEAHFFRTTEAVLMFILKVALLVPKQQEKRIQAYSKKDIKKSMRFRKCKINK